MGPRRGGKHQAAQDLTDICAAAGGEATRLGGLRAMQLATKHLAQAAIRGGVKVKDSERFNARTWYVENSVEKEIAGPHRRTERRAQADLGKLRKAAIGQATIANGFVATRAKCKEVHEEADFEARVAIWVLRAVGSRVTRTKSLTRVGGRCSGTSI